jgi:mannose-6-phosphate isomerase-like protein (cupin superfamily)
LEEHLDSGISIAAMLSNVENKSAPRSKDFLNTFYLQRSENMQSQICSNPQLQNDLVHNSPEPEVFQLRTQLLSKGRSDYTLASTDLMSIRIKCFAQGGENALHAHPAEDHSFIVLDGAARFSGKDGEIGVLTKNQGIMLPKGCYYKFESCGDEPLVMLRVGAQKEEIETYRIGPDGKPLPGKSKENNYEAGVPIEGLYYE